VRANTSARIRVRLASGSFEARVGSSVDVSENGVHLDGTQNGLKRIHSNLKLSPLDLARWGIQPGRFRENVKKCESNERRCSVYAILSSNLPLDPPYSESHRALRSLMTVAANGEPVAGGNGVNFPASDNDGVREETWRDLALSSCPSLIAARRRLFPCFCADGSGLREESSRRVA